MKVLRSVRSGHGAAPGVDALERVLGMRRALHALEHRGAAMLEGDVEVGQHLALGHQRQHVVDMRIGIHIVHAHPDAELAQPARQVEEARFVLGAAEGGGLVAQVHAIGAGVLRDHQQFLDAGSHQPLGLGQHLVDGARGQQAAQRRDDAEAALVVAALGNLQVGIMARREPDALRRHQIDEGIVRAGQVLVARPRAPVRWRGDR